MNNTTFKFILTFLLAFCTFSSVITFSTNLNNPTIVRHLDSNRMIAVGDQTGELHVHTENGAKKYIVNSPNSELKINHILDVIFEDDIGLIIVYESGLVLIWDMQEAKEIRRIQTNKKIFGADFQRIFPRQIDYRRLSEEEQEEIIIFVSLNFEDEVKQFKIRPQIIQNGTTITPPQNCKINSHTYGYYRSYIIISDSCSFVRYYNIQDGLLVRDFLSKDGQVHNLRTSQRHKDRSEIVGLIKNRDLAYFTVDKGLDFIIPTGKNIKQFTICDEPNRQNTDKREVIIVAETNGNLALKHELQDKYYTIIRLTNISNIHCHREHLAALQKNNVYQYQLDTLKFINEDHWTFGHFIFAILIVAGIAGGLYWYRKKNQPQQGQVQGEGLYGRIGEGREMQERQ